MAKTSMVEREKRRSKTAQKYAAKRVTNGLAIAALKRLKNKLSVFVLEFEGTDMRHELSLNATSFRRSASVVRQGRMVTDRTNFESRSLERSNGGFSTRTRTGNANFDLLHAVLLRLLGRIFRRNLRGVGGGLTRPLEAHDARRRPGDGVPLNVGDGHHGVVEAGVHMGNAGGDVLAFFALDAHSFWLSQFASFGSISALP